MSEKQAQIRKLLRQQAAIARFGSFALRQDGLLPVLTEAARVCANGLGVPFSKVCRYRADENDLLIEAGFGWKDGVVGYVVSRADSSSPQGRAFVTGEPSICNDLRTDCDFTLPAFYAEHGIISTIDVVIKGVGDRPYGVLEIDNDEQQDYDEHDINFLAGFANVLAESVQTSERTVILQATVERMRHLVQQKDQLLDQKKVLGEELHHRVRNNLQLVYGMLSKQLGETTDEAGQRGIRAIARRVSTLSQVYDQLRDTEMTKSIDFGAYVSELTRNIATVQAIPDEAIQLHCLCEEVILDLDVVTVLGIVVAELVTNSYDHAFPKGHGTINISVRRIVGEWGKAMLTIEDDGIGYESSAENKRHGVGLVRRLVQQVRGTIAMQAKSGTHWTISFPVQPLPVEAVTKASDAVAAGSTAKALQTASRIIV